VFLTANPARKLLGITLVSRVIPNGSEDTYRRFRNWETLQGGYEIGCGITPER
jgi:hypothetical protein